MTQISSLAKCLPTSCRIIPETSWDRGSEQASPRNPRPSVLKTSANLEEETGDDCVHSGDKQLPCLPPRQSGDQLDRYQIKHRCRRPLATGAGRNLGSGVAGDDRRSTARSWRLMADQQPGVCRHPPPSSAPALTIHPASMSLARPDRRYTASKVSMALAL